MEFRQIEHFYQVCHAGSFTLAAKQLYMTQQGLSKSIALLEQELETQLFNRSPNSISLTESGKAFYGLCEKIIAMVEDSIRQMQSISDVATEKLNIGFFKGVYSFFPPDFFSEFEKSMDKKIVFDLREFSQMECKQRVEDGRLNIAISLEPLQNEPFEKHSLTSCQLYAFLPKNHPLASLEILKPDDLKEYLVVLQNDFRYHYDGLFNYCKNNSLILKVHCKAPNTVALEDFCRSSNCIGLNYYIAKDTRKENNGYIYRYIDISDTTWRVTAITNRKHNLSETEKLLIRKMQHSFDCFSKSTYN